MKEDMLYAAKAELVSLMKRRGNITVKEACILLNLAPSTVRQHLAGLEVDGFVAKRIQRQGVGRPSKYYFLTEKAEVFFKNLESPLLTSLIRVLDVKDQEKLEELFSTVCDQKVARWRRRLAVVPPGETVLEVCRLLEEHGYIPEYSYDAEARLVIELFHCPFPNVTEVVPYQCRCEKRALEELTCTKLSQECSILSGATSCRFRSQKAVALPEAVEDKS